MDDAAWISIAGIATSGVIGPAATAAAARRAARKQFVRDRAGKQRDELAQLIDAATVAASLGATRLREMGLARAGTPAADKTQLWAEEVFSAGQRLALRLGNADPVVTSYLAMRDALVALGELGPTASGPSYDAKLAAFESLRDNFLVEGRRAISAPIPNKEGVS